LVLVWTMTAHTHTLTVTPHVRAAQHGLPTHNSSSTHTHTHTHTTPPPRLTSSHPPPRPPPLTHTHTQLTGTAARVTERRPMPTPCFSGLPPNSRPQCFHRRHTHTANSYGGARDRAAPHAEPVLQRPASQPPSAVLPSPSPHPLQMSRPLPLPLPASRLVVGLWRREAREGGGEVPAS
jgi:hypothetical protein